MHLQKIQFSLYLIVFLFLASSSYSKSLGNFYLLHSKVSIELVTESKYLSRKRNNIVRNFKEYRGWFIFKSIDGRNLVMFGIKRKNLFRFLTSKNGVLKFSKPQTVSFQNRNKTFQLIGGDTIKSNKGTFIKHFKVMHYATKTFLCSKNKLCNEERIASTLEIK